MSNKPVYPGRTASTNWCRRVFTGHGFKLAPVVGRVLSQLAQGKEPSYDLTPFRLSRFSPGAQL